ncbi:DUF5317 family protein [Jannaschia sp. R86511]|uniref:DUF5317 family protein n=1 Tax=Jannaschia sp. R86511 TaxID=3093853 RepID=UPI0036D32F40
MLITVLVLLAVVTVPLTGGTYRGLAATTWRWSWLLPLVLLTQLVLLQTAWVPAAVAPAVHVGSYLLAAGFIVANLRVTGLWLLALGALGNGVAIVANGGTMPASPEALRVAGIQGETGFVNSASTQDARLGWLGDALAVPASWPLANVFSVGDVLIVVGAAWVAHAAARRGAGRAAVAGSDATGSDAIGPEQTGPEVGQPATALTDGSSPSTRSGSSRRSAACTDSGVSTPT